MKKDQITPPVQAAASDEYHVRIHKIEAMRERGIEPWPASKPVNATVHEILQEFNEEKESRNYEIVGRVVAVRKHGKTAFVTLQDHTGRVQIYVRLDAIGDEQFDRFDKFVDIGDILWCSGTSFKTKTGEITIKVRELTLVSKCLHPLPEKFHGLTDIETKYRQRYLDLISNPESRERFVKRSKLIQSLRRFLDEHGFLEVETPLLHSIPGGANARPFVTHHNALNEDLYLRIAPELFLKRLIVGGFDRVYELGRIFRNEGISTKHNPEFTMVELYVANHDLEWMMDFTQALLKRLAQDVNGATTVEFAGHTIDFAKAERISMYDAVIKYAGISAGDLKAEKMDATIKNHNVKIDVKNSSWGQKLYALFDQLVEPKLIQPTFITGFPVEVSPLAKRDPNNPDFVVRFELFVAGMELSNAFNELNDPFDQAQRFQEQAQAKEKGDEEAHHYDAEYVLALEYALPPTVGFGMGIDRLAMMLTGTTSIKDVILFPTLKKK